MTDEDRNDELIASMFEQGREFESLCGGPSH
jgi:hypothetical protein